MDSNIQTLVNTLVTPDSQHVETEPVTLTSEAELLALIRSLQKSRDLMQLQLNSLQNNIQSTSSTSKLSKVDLKINNLKNLMHEFKLMQVDYMTLISQISNKSTSIYEKLKSKLHNCKCKDLEEVVSKNLELNKLVDELNNYKIEKSQEICVNIEDNKRLQKENKNLKLEITNLKTFQEDSLKTIKSLESQIIVRENLISKFTEVNKKCQKLSNQVEIMESEKSVLNQRIAQATQEHRNKLSAMQDQISNLKKEISNLNNKLDKCKNLANIMSEDVSSIMSVYSMSIKDHEYVLYEDECLNNLNMLCKVMKILHPIVVDQQNKFCKIDEDLLKHRELSANYKTENNELQKRLSEALLQLFDCQNDLERGKRENTLLSGRLKLCQQQNEKVEAENDMKTKRLNQLELLTGELQFSLRVKEDELSTLQQDFKMMKQANDVFLDSSCISNTDKQIIKQLLCENISLRAKLELMEK